jgi:hypothetical protein
MASTLREKGSLAFKKNLLEIVEWALATVRDILLRCFRFVRTFGCSGLKNV